jgi:hypothetical protein
MAPLLWAAHYISDEEMSTSNFVKVVDDGVLKGYAVFTVLSHEKIKPCRIAEICADSPKTLRQLIDQIMDYSVKNGIDFIFLRKGEEPIDIVFDERGFTSFVECVIMSVLLDPYKLLLSMSDNLEGGRILELTIRGFRPILVEVGRRKIRVVEQGRRKPDLRVYTDSKTFLELFFGKTSFLKEYLKRKVTVNKTLSMSTAAHFFDIVRQEKSYIPLGDWV